MKQETMTKTFVKKLDNGYLINELVLTNEWEKIVKNLENKGVSEEGIQAILLPYDPVNKTNEVDKKYVSVNCQYFKKTL